MFRGAVNNAAVRISNKPFLKNRPNNLKYSQKCLNDEKNINNCLFNYSEEVIDAKKYGKPIVALESTIITHGMPYPDNFYTAKRVEDVIRNEGAVPATIGILEGRIQVGIDEAGLKTLSLANVDKNDNNKLKTVKCSRRDFSWVIANRYNGGTTVSGTLLVANLAGIKIMATGGIGGVHRYADKTFDVSADLNELGRNSIAVVCSGVKAILDIKKSLEYLETQGVPVITISKDNKFPAFYSRRTVDGIESPYTVSNAKNAAGIVIAQREIGLESGILFAVPIPEDHAIDPREIETAIEEALIDADNNNIKGKEITPYLLDKVNEITAGKSLRSNKALIENNAKVAAEIAVIVNNDDKNNISPKSDGNTVKKSSTNKSGPVVIGGSIFDTVVQLGENNINLDGRTHEGICRESCGGVGRNVADALIKLGINCTKLISVVGDDYPGKIIRESINKYGNDFTVKVLKDVNTSRYVAFVDSNGECKFGVGQMNANNLITPNLIENNIDILKEAGIIIIDGNPPLETINKVLYISEEYKIPVWYEPTDFIKAKKIFESSDRWKESLHFISPNVNELFAIARHLGVDSVPSYEQNIDLESVKRIAEQVNIKIPVVITTLGSRGLMVTRKANATDPFYNKEGKLITNDDIGVQTRIYPPISLPSSNCTNNTEEMRIVSVSGCGDCLAAGVIRGIQEGLDEIHCVKLALKAASVSLTSHDPVPDSLSALNIYQR